MREDREASPEVWPLRYMPGSPRRGRSARAYQGSLIKEQASPERSRPPDEQTYKGHSPKSRPDGPDSSIRRQKNTLGLIVVLDCCGYYPAPVDKTQQSVRFAVVVQARKRAPCSRG